MYWCMEKNNMRNEKHMRQNRNRNTVICHFFRLAMVVGLVLAASCANAQDAIPETAIPDQHSIPAYSSNEIKHLMKFVPIDNPMPSSFRETAENVIQDPTGSLNPFWAKLTMLDRPLRIVHIGDSHVRGHVFPYVMRLCLEDDFGGRAVEQTPVTYQTSGIATETGENGIVYHMLGVNGATYRSFATPERLDEIASLSPDLIIISFGTNEAHARNYDAYQHLSAMKYLVNTLKKSCPNTVFLLTTPPGAYVRVGRRGRTINPRTPSVVANELKFARENDLAVWNMYDIVGGKKRACLNWSAADYFKKDKIHFTLDGYKIQGLLLHEAFIKAYNRYVGDRLAQAN